MPKVLITGANRGLGLEFVRQYSAERWDVVATVRDLSEADELQGTGARVEQLDLRSLEAVALFGVLLGEAPLDLLIANAGTWIPERVESVVDAGAWVDMFTINAVAPYLLARSCLDQVAAARGKLIAITSKMGSIADNGSGGYVPYRSTKAALNAAWRSLAIDARSLGITAAVLHPGWVRTRMGGGNAPMAPEHSVAGMRRTIEGLKPEQSGGFFNHDGSIIPW